MSSRVGRGPQPERRPAQQWWRMGWRKLPLIPCWPRAAPYAELRAVRRRQTSAVGGVSNLLDAWPWVVQVQVWVQTRAALLVPSVRPAVATASGGFRPTWRVLLVSDQETGRLPLSRPLQHATTGWPRWQGLAARVSRPGHLGHQCSPSTSRMSYRPAVLSARKRAARRLPCA